jgi:RNA polymerase sigma factor (sigma-70 family)
MDSSDRGSVTTWLDGLKADHDQAAQELWNRYFAQLVTVARRHLHGVGRVADEEDVALSALKSAMLGVQNNRFPELNDRTGLWPLLVTITARKALNEHKRRRTQKRNPSVELPLTDVQTIAGRELSPDFALQLSDAIQSLIGSLGDDTLQVIAQRKLEGYSNSEIAQELDVSTRTIDRKLARVRQEWDEAAEQF